MTIPAATLRITDGVTAIDLISPDRGWHLSDWQPSYPGQDVGYRQSPMADGRVPVTRRYDYPIEQMTYVLDADNPDLFIATRRKLDKMLKQALDYWKDDWRTEPVWLEVRGTYESDMRYAVVVSGLIGPYPYPFGGSMVPATGASTQGGLTLSLEHTFWQDEIPGSSHCLEASAQTYGMKAVVFKPTEQDDDCYVDTAGAGAITLNSAGIRFGEAAASEYHAGVRFRAVTIPQGARIQAAYVHYVAENNRAANDVKIRIYGHDADAAAIFSTYADFMARVLTSAYGNIPAWGAHVLGTAYQTVDVTTAVQEIISRAGWVSGNALALIWQNQAGTTAAAYRDMASFDSALAEPELHIVYEDTATLIGRAATCLPEVYVANKQNTADITHIFTYDLSITTYSANLKGGALPHDLFAGVAAGPDNGDITYFGSECVPDNPRPFCNMVFNIGTIAVYGAGDSVAWQYWNGGWVALSSFVDMTSTTVWDLSPTSFASEAGVNGCYWAQPTDWVPTVVNGISAMWIRGVVTEATGISRATQAAIRQIYSIITAFIDVDEETAALLPQLRGDMPLPLRIYNYGQGLHEENGGGVRRFMIGMRTVERGTNFSPYLHCSSTQNGAGIFSYGSPAAGIVSNMSSTGMALQEVFAAAILPFASLATWTVYRNAYQGTFHAFLRYNVPAGNDGDLRARIMVDNGSYFYGASVPLIVAAVPLVYTADLGIIEIVATIPGSLNVTSSIAVQTEQPGTTGRTINLIGLVLMPADEWLGDFSFIRSNHHLQEGFNCEVDSVTYAKQALSTLTVNTVNTGTIDAVIGYAIQPVTLSPGKQQRLWYYMDHNETAAPSIDDSPPSLALAVKVTAAARYLNMRGDD